MYRPSVRGTINRRMAMATGTLVTILVWSGVTAVASAASPDPALLPSQPHGVAIFQGPEIKGMAVVYSDLRGEDGLLTMAMQGISPSATYRLVLSAQPCGTPHRPSTAGPRFEAIDGSGVASSFWARRTVLQLLPYMEQDNLRSMRLVRTTTPRGHVACARVTRYWDQSQIAAPTIADENLRKVFVSSFRGALAAVVPEAPGVRLSFEDIRQATAKRRLVGSTEPCGTSHTKAETVFTYGYEAPSAGTFRAGAHAPAVGDPLALESVRLFGGTSGFLRPAGCGMIIAVLIGP